MERRDFLLSVGSVTTVGVGAGCLGGGGSSDSTEHIEQAADYLDEAGRILEEDSNDNGSFNANRILRRTDAARDEISLARGDASDNEIDLLDDLELLADVMDDLASIIESSSEFVDNMDTIEALVSAGRFDDAEEEVENVSDDIGDIQDQTQNVTDIYDQINADAYDKIDELSQADIDEWATEMEELLNSLDILFDAFGHMIEGLSTFEDGDEEWRAENWGAAAVRFDDAAGQFDDSLSIIRDAEDEAPNEFRSEFIEIGCLTESLRDASEHYADAMNHASNNQWNDAEDAIAEGDRAFDSC